jgi:predicted NAD/FAD-binding protein
MRIAIIGTGISGMTAAHLLHRAHDLTIYESDQRIGGHTNTVDVIEDERRLGVDTGFIVCNDRTYPNFLGLMRQLGVRLQPSEMTFSVQHGPSGLEWAGANLDTLFCQRRNLVRFSFLRMVREILRFNREAQELLASGDEITLGDYVRAHGYHREFIEHYLLPMGGAIWSSSATQMLAFPARFFVRFFHHHGMLTVDDRPTWFTVAGGSRTYRDALTTPFREAIRVGDGARRVRRDADGAVVTAGSGEQRFDAVVFACHADDALALIDGPTAAERAVLSAFPYQNNRAVLHTDEAILPRARRAWSAWNVHVPTSSEVPIAVTYDLTNLQRLATARRYLVTLNDTRMSPASIIRTIDYRHPVFTAASPAAQARHGEINGVDRFHFAGAYWRNGFHEDGVVSAIAACAPLTGVTTLADAA